MPLLRDGAVRWSGLRLYNHVQEGICHCLPSLVLISVDNIELLVRSKRLEEFISERYLFNISERRKLLAIFDHYISLGCSERQDALNGTESIIQHMASRHASCCLVS